MADQQTQKPKTSRKKVFIGCGGLLVIGILIAVGIVSTCPPETSTPIRDNVTAERHIKVGMTVKEIGRLTEPGTRYAVLNLSMFRPGDPPLFKVTSGIDGPYYAWAFPPTVVASSRPTLAFFDGSTNEVIAVARFSCDSVIQMIKAQGGRAEGFGACSE